MWVAVLFTVLSSAGNSIGKVLQKQGTKGLPQLSLSIKVMRAYISSRTWILGFCLDILGALAMLKAVSEAPVSVVQPVSGCGLAILAVFSHFHLRETMNSLDWLGVALAGTGTVGVGMAGEEQRSSQLHLLRLVWIILWVFLLFGAVNWWVRAKKKSARMHELPGSVLPPIATSHSGVIEEMVAGMEAGTCFGMASIFARLGFMLVEKGHSKFYIPAGILAGVCCSASGFFCQTKGLKDGRAVVVSTCAAVASIITGVIIGMLVLGETLPVSAFRQFCLLIGWLLIILGVILLMDSNRVGLLLPRSIRRILKLKGSSHKSNPPRSAQFSRRDSNSSTVVQLFTPPKSSTN
ncbi:hypothetical protein GOP47_0010677 [Adiantum capillus-veneris]|uniref:Probable magnesium transporter n=1 Tax=Adiantum capillus-veneris TaxID=13818 RepID=A0A9D4UVJ8_ADICA|nr:hypothetical protein GOP47_0010677 [Adiantum capillus-veneris]